MDVVGLNEKGAALTMESIIAALVLIGAISFLVVSFPTQFNQHNQRSRIQLKEYGKNFIHSSAHKALESGEIIYNLYRDYSPRENQDSGGEPGNKWNYDDVSSENITTIDYKGTEYDWTKNYLVIDYEDEIWPDGYSENLTVNYLAKNIPASNFLYPKDNGTLYQLLPFGSDGRPHIYSYESKNSITVNENGKEDSTTGRNYSVSMIWFESGPRTSNPSIVWTDKKPQNHDEKVVFDENESQGTVNKTIHFAHIVQGQYVIVNKQEKRGQLQVFGYNDTTIKGEGSEKGVTIEDIGKPGGEYKVIFESPAKGGYAIQQGTGWGAGSRSDPIFVMVGKPKLGEGKRLIGEYSYLEALAFGDISLDRFRAILNSTIPDNVGYNFYVYDSNGSILKSRTGEKLMIINGSPPSGSVSVEGVIFLPTGVNEYKTCSVRIVLWYH